MAAEPFSRPGISLGWSIKRATDATEIFAAASYRKTEEADTLTGLSLIPFSKNLFNPAVHCPGTVDAGLAFTPLFED